FREGFLHSDTALRPGHLLCAMACVESFTLYAVIGVSKYARLGAPTYVSTLACALLLVLVLCWIATAAAFFFDRYRVPVLAVLAVLPLATAWVPWSDHFYQTYAAPQGYSSKPGAILNLDADRPAIVIATE